MTTCSSLGVGLTNHEPARTGQKQEADMNITSAKFAATMFTTLVVSLAIQAGYYFCCLKSLAL